MPTSERRSVLVAGAAGRLGVIDEILLARGHAVRAMTRNPASPDAARLAAAGAEIVRGDFDDPASIERAAGGVDAVFATGTAHKTGPEGELRHGRNLADAAAAAGVPHLVYSSGDGASPDSPLPLFRAKHRVEQHIRSLAIAHTILAPVYFMENLFNPWNVPALQAGVFPSPIPVDQPLQQVAIIDLARFATIAIERPSEFAGQRMTIASDELTGQQAASALSKVVGREVAAEQADVDQLPPGLQALFRWLREISHNADIASLHRRYPEVDWHDYQGWVTSERERLPGVLPA
jgi:uncharacterized protein YbjT (DUF2867 family)